jgi:hypothetical protein
MDWSKPPDHLPDANKMIRITINLSSPDARRKAADKLLATGRLTLKLPLAAIMADTDS